MAWGDGDRRGLLVRESLLTGTTGLVMLASVVWGKPLRDVLQRQPVQG